MTCRTAMKRPQALRRTGFLGTQPKRSRPRWDASSCRFYVGACWASFNTASTLIAVSGVNSSEWTIGLVAGSVSTLSWMGCVGWVVKSLCPRRPSADEQTALRERGRQVMARIDDLARQIRDAERLHKPRRHLEQERIRLVADVLAGRV